MRSLFLALLWSRHSLPNIVFSVGKKKEKERKRREKGGKHPWIKTNTRFVPIAVCMLVAFTPHHRWLILVHNLKPSSVSIFPNSTASSDSSSHALPSVQPQAPLALGGSSLHLDCPLRNHLNPMWEHIYAPQLSFQKVCRYLAQDNIQGGISNH